MKEIILIILLGIFIVPFTQAQLLVSDPTNTAQSAQTTAQMLQLTVITQQFKEIQDKVEKVKESIDWIKKTQAVVELIHLMESTTCIIEELKFTMSISADLGVTDSCIDDFKFNVSISRLLLSLDQISSVLSSGTKMTQAERWSIVTTVFNNFVECQMSFSSLNKELKGRVYQQRYINAHEELADEGTQDFLEQMIKYYN